jgi:hypothetical protein
MSNEVFIERSRLGKRIFELKDSTLTISGTSRLKKFEQTFPLGFTSPNYIRARRRLHSLIQRPLVAACFVLFMIRSLSFLPSGLYALVVEFLAFIIVVFVLTAIRGITPFEVVIFKNTSGRAQFDLVKEKNQAKEFEEFVANIESAIRGEVGSTSTGIHLALDQADDESRPNSYFCISSLAVGSLWVEVSHLVFWVKFGGSDSFVGFLVSLLAVGLCLGSFVRGEKLRFLSLVGAALTLAPLYIH